MEFVIAKPEDRLAVVEQNATLEVLTGLFGKSSKSLSVGRIYGGGGFYFNAPDFASSGNYTIDFDLVFVPVVEKSDVRISPACLGDELLKDERFQEVAETITFGRPVFRVQIGEGCSQSRITDVNLGSLDESLCRVSVPGREATDEEELLKDGQVAIHSLAIHIEIVAEGGHVQEFCGSQRHHLQQALHLCAVLNPCHIVDVPLGD